MCLACAALPAARAPADGAPAGPPPFPGEGGPFPWPSAPPIGGTLRWTGVAGIVLAVGTHRVAFDPFVSRPGLVATLFRRPRARNDLVRERFSDLDAVFVGHTHYDHAMDLGAVLEASPRATVHGSATTGELLFRLGAPATSFVLARDASRFEVGPFTVEAVASRHGRVPYVGRIDRIEMPRRGLPWTPFRYPRGAVLAWRVEVGGRAVFVQGSAGLDDGALARQKPADVLLACLAARKGTPGYLERLAEALRPRVLAPLHHDDFFRPLSDPPRAVPGLDWPSFLADAHGLAERHGTRLWVPPRDRDVEI